MPDGAPSGEPALCFAPPPFFRPHPPPLFPFLVSDACSLCSITATRQDGAERGWPAVWAAFARGVLAGGRTKKTKSIWSHPRSREARQFRRHVEDVVCSLKQIGDACGEDAVALRDRHARVVTAQHEQGEAHGKLVLHVCIMDVLARALRGCNEAEREAAQNGAMPMRVQLEASDVLRGVVERTINAPYGSVRVHVYHKPSFAAFARLLLADADKSGVYFSDVSSLVANVVHDHDSAHHVLLGGGQQRLFSVWAEAAGLRRRARANVMRRIIFCPLPYA